MARIIETYELQPTDGRKSCYGKAKVAVLNNGAKELYSYGTLIMRKHQNGKLERIWDGWSATTGRHIKYFCGLNKKQYFEL